MTTSTPIRTEADAEKVIADEITAASKFHGFMGLHSGLAASIVAGITARVVRPLIHERYAIGPDVDPTESQVDRIDAVLRDVRGAVEKAKAAQSFTDAGGKVWEALTAQEHAEMGRVRAEQQARIERRGRTIAELQTSLSRSRVREGELSRDLHAAKAEAEAARAAGAHDATNVDRLTKTVDHWRHEVGKKESRITKLEDALNIVRNERNEAKFKLEHTDHAEKVQRARVAELAGELLTMTTDRDALAEKLRARIVDDPAAPCRETSPGLAVVEDCAERPPLSFNGAPTPWSLTNVPEAGAGLTYAFGTPSGLPKMDLPPEKWGEAGLRLAFNHALAETKLARASRLAMRHDMTTAERHADRLHVENRDLKERLDCALGDMRQGDDFARKLQVDLTAETCKLAAARDEVRIATGRLSNTARQREEFRMKWAEADRLHETTKGELRAARADLDTMTQERDGYVEQLAKAEKANGTPPADLNAPHVVVSRPGTGGPTTLTNPLPRVPRIMGLDLALGPDEHVERTRFWTARGKMWNGEGVELTFRDGWHSLVHAGMPWNQFARFDDPKEAVRVFGITRSNWIGSDLDHGSIVPVLIDRIVRTTHTEIVATLETVEALS